MKIAQQNQIKKFLAEIVVIFISIKNNNLLIKEDKINMFFCLERKQDIKRNRLGRSLVCLFKSQKKWSETQITHRMQHNFPGLDFIGYDDHEYLEKCGMIRKATPQKTELYEASEFEDVWQKVWS